MFPFKNISIISKSALFFMALVYFADFTSGGFIANIFALNPYALIHKFEIWRIITFPLIGGSAEAILLFSLTFYYISSRLELLVDKLRYPFWLFTLVFLQGIVLTLLFWKSNIIIGGMEGISFFIITFYSLIQPKSKIKFLKFRPIPIYLFSFMLVAIWLALKVYSYTYLSTNISFLPSLASALFGVTLGSMIYLQIRISQKMSRNYNVNKDKNLKVTAPKELSMSMISGQKLRKQFHQQREEYKEDDYLYQLTNDAAENEEKLNILLEKIFINGKDSLSFMELKFLKDYSKKL